MLSVEALLGAAQADEKPLHQTPKLRAGLHHVVKFVVVAEAVKAARAAEAAIAWHRAV